jgi:hypothetical protein
LEPLNYIHSFWEGGAAAFNRIDEWSDIDLYLVVDDNKVDEAFFAVEKVLKSLSPIKQKYEVVHPLQSGVFQAFYKLEEASQFLMSIWLSWYSAVQTSFWNRRYMATSCSASTNPIE